MSLAGFSTPISGSYLLVTPTFWTMSLTRLRISITTEAVAVYLLSQEEEEEKM